MRALILQSKSSMPRTSYARAQTTDYLNNHSNLFYRENLIGKRYLNMHTTHAMGTRKRLRDKLFKYTHCSITFNWSVKVSQSCIIKGVLQDLLEALTIVKTLWSSNVLFHYIINLQRPMFNKSNKPINPGSKKCRNFEKRWMKHCN